MALGTLGSTLNDELNRLANGGTYRDMNQMVDEALAAKQWANRENIIPYSTDTVGILNEIAGLGLDKKNWLDFNGVCNYIAGTTGLPAAAALRQVYPTTDLLTGVASYYVDATAPTNWGSLGYVYLPGVAGNYLSVPDASNLDITGDIDIRVQVAMDDWTPATITNLISKASASNISYRFQVDTAGLLTFGWSSDGTTLGSTRFSTVATGIADGATKWVRVTVDVDNGASGNDTKFWLSDDGTTWTQLGSTVTNAGVISFFSGTSEIAIGLDLIQGRFLAGKVYRAQILNGIGGTTVLDVNIATDYKSSNLDFFTATTGQTVTVNGVGTVANLGAAGSLLPTTVGSSTAADSNDPKFLDHTGTNYVYLPGTASNQMFTPRATATDITGDIDIRVKVAMDDWTPSGLGYLIGKLDTGVARAYGLGVNTDGTLRFAYSTDGSTLTNRLSTVATGVADGATKWVRVTFDVDNGAGGNDVKFFTSDDGTTWTQLGTTVTNAGTVTMFNGNCETLIGGSSSSANLPTAKIFRAQIFASIDGSDKRLDVDTSVITAGSATSFTAVTGQTVTITRSTSGRKTVAVTQPTWLFGTDDYMEVNNRYMSSGTYLYLPDIASNNASTPDAAALDVTGDIDIRLKVALDDWTPAAESALLSKWGAAGQRSYAMTVTSAGRLAFAWTADGSTILSGTSTVSPTITDGSTLWVRVTLDVDNGASGRDVKFFTSTDGTTWTQLGTTITQAGITSIFNSTNSLHINGFGGTSSMSRGKFFRAQVLNGIDGTVVFDANFETSITSLLQTSFTESSTNAATVTINRSGSTYRSAGITAAGYLYPGATNTFSASATDFLNFGAADSFTVMFIHRRYGNVTNGNGINKEDGTISTSKGWFLDRLGTANGITLQIKDGTFSPQASVDTVSGALATLVVVRNVASDNLLAYNNGASGTAVTDTTTGNLNSYSTMKIGLRTNAGYGDFEFVGAAVFRTVLTPTQIRQIVNYFANREVYL